MKKGRLVVFEGLDGVGKTTASMHLAARLGATWTATLSAAPGPSADCAVLRVRAVLKRSVEIRKLLAAGEDVVCDGYWLSALGYAVARGSQLPLLGFEHMIAPARLTVLLTVHDVVRNAGLARRGSETKEKRASLDPAGTATSLRTMREGLEHRVVGLGFELDVTNLGVEAMSRIVLGVLEIQQRGRGGDRCASARPHHS